MELEQNGPLTPGKVPDYTRASDGGDNTFKSSHWSRRQKVLLAGLSCMIFLANTCFSLQAPFFPTEAGKKGVSSTVIGFIFGSYELSKCLTSPLWGYSISRIGVKFMFLSGVIVCGSCAVLFGVLDRGPDGTIFIVMCFLCRSLEGVGTAAFMTAGYAIVAHEFPDDTATVYGTLQTCIGFGNMAGPPIGGAFYELGGYGLPFYVNGVMVIVIGLLCCILLPSVQDTQEEDKGSTLQMLRQPLTLVVGFSIVAGSFSLGFMDPTLAPHLSVFNLNNLVVGFIFLVAPGVYAITAPFIGRLSDKKDVIIPLIIIGNIGMAVVFMAIGPAPFLPFLPLEIWSQILTLVIDGVFLCFSLCPTFNGLIKSARSLGLPDDVNTHGMVSGISVSCFALGAFMGPILGGTLVDNFKFPWAACFVSLMFILSASLMSTYSVWSRVKLKTIPTKYAKLQNGSCESKLTESNLH